MILEDRTQAGGQCLAMPSPFGTIGQSYADFRQVRDDEVHDPLDRSAPARGEPAGPAPP